MKLPGPGLGGRRRSRHHPGPDPEGSELSGGVDANMPLLARTDLTTQCPYKSNGLG
jgi:hypothetical protein